MQKLFGTDGIRGVANQFPMTGELAMAVGRAVAHILNRYGHSAKNRAQFGHGLSRRTRIVVGKDTRVSGYMIETAITSGICSMGADAILIGPLPTPGVAFVTQSMRADAGIMISASHNAFQDNGIKIFASDGFKLPDEAEREIESIIFSRQLETKLPVGDSIGRATRIEDVHGRYLVYLKALFPQELDLQRVRIALDCANGAGYKVAPLVFEELGAEVIKTSVQPNGLNINDKCGALYPEKIAGTTREIRADIGIALDGDGDRCILTDELGSVIDGDIIMGLCAIRMKAEGKLKHNTVVATPMSNYGLEATLKAEGISLVRAPVGDRYVVEEMKKGGFNLGGEQSGHIIFLDHTTTGDGILAALRILEIIARTGKPLSELRNAIKLFPQVRNDVRVKDRTPFDEIVEVRDLIKEAESTLSDRGRVFVRYSGTEPLARIMVEGENHNEIQVIASAIAKAITKALG